EVDGERAPDRHLDAVELRRAAELPRRREREHPRGVGADGESEGHLLAVDGEVPAHGLVECDAKTHLPLLALPSILLEPRMGGKAPTTPAAGERRRRAGTAPSFRPPARRPGSARRASPGP